MMLTVEKLSYSYGKNKVLRDISFSAAQGEFISVLGPNGVGKSTLFRCILGIYRNFSGKILLGEKNLLSLSTTELAKRVAYIPQIHRPTFGYTALDTVMMGLTRQMSAFMTPKAVHRKKAQTALERLGVSGLAERNFANLSGGEQQLVLVARALVQEAEVLVMDEPTSALDYGNQFRILEQVRQLAAEGYTVLLSTHNPQQALDFADRILALSDGHIEAFGTPDEVINEALMENLYGVRVHFAETAKRRFIVPEGRNGT